MEKSKEARERTVFVWQFLIFIIFIKLKIIDIYN